MRRPSPPCVCLITGTTVNYAAVLLIDGHLVFLSCCPIGSEEQPSAGVNAPVAPWPLPPFLASCSRSYLQVHERVGVRPCSVVASFDIHELFSVLGVACVAIVPVSSCAGGLTVSCAFSSLLRGPATCTVHGELYAVGVSKPIMGHIMPLLSVLQQLASQGNKVALLTSEVRGVLLASTVAAASCRAATLRKLAVCVLSPFIPSPQV